ncbi:hypothetical protein I656_00963 [Geobacillus sp. WSUCF1]|nr:hypothetical protein I656_00963 [Geobacillus sp. WSUCF1]
MKTGMSICAGHGGEKRERKETEQQEEVKRWVRSSSPLCLP